MTTPTQWVGETNNAEAQRGDMGKAVFLAVHHKGFGHRKRFACVEGKKKETGGLDIKKEEGARRRGKGGRGVPRGE